MGDRMWRRPAMTQRARLLGALVVAAAAVSSAWSAESTCEKVSQIVTQIRRADYEGDRAALKRLHAELAPCAEDEKLDSRVSYWRGFALWRRSINGFNDSADPIELEADLAQAAIEFDAASAADPEFVDAIAGAASCLGYEMYLNSNDPERLQELAADLGPRINKAREAAPGHPRLVWVMGPMVWNSPPERGGGQDKAIESYEKALETLREQKGGESDPLEPSWGEAELLMSLA